MHFTHPSPLLQQNQRLKWVSMFHHLSGSPKMHTHMSVSCSAEWQSNFTVVMGSWVAALFLILIPPKILGFPLNLMFPVLTPSQPINSVLSSLLSRCDTATWWVFPWVYLMDGLCLDFMLHIVIPRLGLPFFTTLTIDCNPRCFSFSERISKCTNMSNL